MPLVKTNRRIGSAGYASVMIGRTRSGSPAAPSTSQSNIANVQAENAKVEEENASIIQNAGGALPKSPAAPSATSKPIIGIGKKQGGGYTAERLDTQLTPQQAARVREMASETARSGGRLGVKKESMKKSIARYYRGSTNTMTFSGALPPGQGEIQEPTRIEESQPSPSPNTMAYVRDYFEKNPEATKLTISEKGGPTFEFTKDTRIYGTLEPASPETKRVMERERVKEKIMGTANYAFFLGQKEEYEKSSDFYFGKVKSWFNVEGGPSQEIGKIARKILKTDSPQTWTPGKVTYNLGAVPYDVSKTLLVDYPVYAPAYSGGKMAVETITSGGGNLFDLGYGLYDAARNPRPESIRTIGGFAGTIAAPVIAYKAFGMRQAETSKAGPKGGLVYDALPPGGAPGVFEYRLRRSPTKLWASKTGSLRGGKGKPSKAYYQSQSRGQSKQPAAGTARKFEGSYQGKPAIMEVTKKGGVKTTIISQSRPSDVRALIVTDNYQAAIKGRGAPSEVVRVVREMRKGRQPFKITEEYTPGVKGSRRLTIGRVEGTPPRQILEGRPEPFKYKAFKVIDKNKPGTPKISKGFASQLKTAGISKTQYLKEVKSERMAQQQATLQYQKGGFRRGMRERLAQKVQGLRNKINSQRQITPVHEYQKAMTAEQKYASWNKLNKREETPGQFGGIASLVKKKTKPKLIEVSETTSRGMVPIATTESKLSHPNLEIPKATRALSIASTIKYGQLPKPETKNGLVSENKINYRLAQKAATEQAQILKPATATEQSQAQIQISKTQQKTVQKTKPDITDLGKGNGGGGGRSNAPNNPPPPIPPFFEPPRRESPGRIVREVIKPVKPPVRIPPGKRMSPVESAKSGFDVFVRRKKKFVKMNIFALGREDALSFGANIVRNTAAATFKIMPSTQKAKGKFRGPPSRLGGFIKKGGLFIQPRRERISTLGEKREITFKGIGASKNKRKKNRWW